MYINTLSKISMYLWVYKCNWKHQRLLSQFTFFVDFIVILLSLFDILPMLYHHFCLFYVFPKIYDVTYFKSVLGFFYIQYLNWRSCIHFTTILLCSPLSLPYLHIQYWSTLCWNRLNYLLCGKKTFPCSVHLLISVIN